MRSPTSAAGKHNLQNYADPTGDQKRLATAVGAWSTDLRTFVKLVKEQPLDLSQMNWQVGIMDVSLLVATGKLEKLVEWAHRTAWRGGQSDHRIGGCPFITRRL